ncbi:hypothetical protein CBR_g59258, partial [Chara braunii]
MARAGSGAPIAVRLGKQLIVDASPLQTRVQHHREAMPIPIQRLTWHDGEQACCRASIAISARISVPSPVLPTPKATNSHVPLRRVDAYCLASGYGDRGVATHHPREIHPPPQHEQSIAQRRKLGLPLETKHSGTVIFRTKKGGKGSIGQSPANQAQQLLGATRASSGCLHGCTWSRSTWRFGSYSVRRNNAAAPVHGSCWQGSLLSPSPSSSFSSWTPSPWPSDKLRDRHVACGGSLRRGRIEEEHGTANMNVGSVATCMTPGQDFHQVEHRHSSGGLAGEGSNHHTTADFGNDRVESESLEQTSHHLSDARESCDRSNTTARVGCNRMPKVLAVIGGGAAGIFGALRAKDLCRSLQVAVFEKTAPLSKVRISGGGRCNVTTGLYVDALGLAAQYPRGNRELKGAYFRTHGPLDTVEWFEKRGVALKTEEDGRMFPVSNSSSTIVDCLLNEAARLQ